MILWKGLELPLQSPCFVSSALLALSCCDRSRNTERPTWKTQVVLHQSYQYQNISDPQPMRIRIHSCHGSVSKWSCLSQPQDDYIPSGPFGRGPAKLCPDWRNWGIRNAAMSNLISNNRQRTLVATTILLIKLWPASFKLEFHETTFLQNVFW